MDKVYVLLAVDVDLDVDGYVDGYVFSQLDYGIVEINNDQKNCWHKPLNSFMGIASFFSFLCFFIKNYCISFMSTV